jgi:hypothetical protein
MSLKVRLSVDSSPTARSSILPNSLAAFLARTNRLLLLSQLACQFRKGQPPANHTPRRKIEPLRIAHFPVVEPERLLIQVTEQMNGSPQAGG